MGDSYCHCHSNFEAQPSSQSSSGHAWCNITFCYGIEDGMQKKDTRNIRRNLQTFNRRSNLAICLEGLTVGHNGMGNSCDRGLPTTKQSWPTLWQWHSLLPLGPIISIYDYSRMSGQVRHVLFLSSPCANTSTRVTPTPRPPETGSPQRWCNGAAGARLKTGEGRRQAPLVDHGASTRDLSTNG
jgi:hypothetical protein